VTCYPEPVFPGEKSAVTGKYVRVKIRKSGKKTKIVVHLGGCMCRASKAVIMVVKPGFHLAVCFLRSQGDGDALARGLA
jgi:hypothetical protein